MEELIGGFLLIVVAVIAGDVFGGFGSRLLVRPGTTPPRWAEPLMNRWGQGADDDSLY